MDPGQALEYSLAKFITNLQNAQNPKPLVAAIDPLQRLKAIMQESKQAVKKDTPAKGQLNSSIPPYSSRQ
jgi:hypothetical protein